MKQITNLYNPEAKRPKLQVETKVLFWPDEHWTYSHHPHITFFKNKYYAFWSNGRVNEDDVGQRILMSESVDFENWSEPEPLVDSVMGKFSELVLSAGGVYTTEERMSVYIGSFEYRPEALNEDGTRKPEEAGHMDTNLFMVSTTDGVNWTPLQDMKMPIAPNFGPQPTPSGRLILCGGMMFPYTDDPTGQSGWQLTGIYPKDDPSPSDDSASIWEYKERMGWDNIFCEGSFYETEDGILHMLLRTNTERLWVTESIDDGTTWTAPRPTEFTDNATKFHFGRLPDGRYYYVGCPDPEPRWQRNPLVLSISEDGYTFDRHFIIGDERFARKSTGIHKGGYYGYPHTMILDGHLYVIYSICKEGVGILRVSIETI